MVLEAKRVVSSGQERRRAIGEGRGMLPKFGVWKMTPWVCAVMLPGCPHTIFPSSPARARL